MPFTRTYNWGESLRLEAAMADGGLSSATDRIHASLGATIGSRNTFAALFALDEPPTDTRRCERAYVLLTALGQDPADWGLGDFQPPTGWAETLVDLRESVTGWFPHTLKVPALTGR
jgi:hypothetical protein